MSSLFGIGGGGNVGASGSFYETTIDQSLRFNDNDSAYLSRTPASAGNLTTWTWSGWVKRCNLTNGALFSANYSSNQIVFNSDRLYFEHYDGSNNNYKISTDKLRDTSAWYHLVFVWDTSNATAADRMRMYINSRRVTNFDSSSNPSLNVSSKFNTAIAHEIGHRINPSNFYLDAYLAEVNFIDGTALDPTSFGEASNGVWVPKAYSGSYGTNGFYLSFADSAAIGDDLSGNTNDWTANNLAASDVMSGESPTNNFATLNFLSRSTTANWTLSEGNLHCAAPSSSGWQSVRGTHGVSSGKWYWEVEFDAGTMTEIFCGIMNQNTVPHATSDFNDTTGVVLFYNHVGGEIRYNNTLTDNNYGTLVAGDILGVALNMDDKQLSFYKNGSAIVTNFDIDITGITTVVPAAASDGFSVVLKFNFGQDSANVSSANSDENGIGTFEYAVPSGFLALCSANLPEPDIGPNSTTTSDQNFNTVLWTGDGASSRGITGVGHAPDFVWIKTRNQANEHSLFDSVRGVAKDLESNSTAAEQANNVNGYINSFDSDGFTVVDGSSGGALVNYSGNTFASWNWKAGGAPTVDNSAGAGATPTAGSVKIDGSNLGSALAGSIAATRLSANTSNGCSILTYTGNATAGATVAHGLSSAPEMIIVKARNQAYNWTVYHSGTASDAETDYLVLDGTAAANDLNTVWNDTAPTNSVFSLGTFARVNAVSEPFIAYCFHSVEGHSRVTSYVGNASTDGTFCYLGHRPAWIMLKNASASGSWYIFDVKRNTYNAMDNYLRPNLSNAEGNLDFCDFTSNGFKIRSSAAEWNGSGNTIIVLSFAEAPFKYANAR